MTPTRSQNRLNLLWVLFCNPFVDEGTTEMPRRVVTRIRLNATHGEFQSLLCWCMKHVANQHPVIPAVEVALIEVEQGFAERDFTFL